MREKNIMNRLTALIISMIMAIGILYVPANAAIAAEESKNEIGLLRAVGILPNEDLSAEKMTRANFALYTTRLMGMSAFDENNERYFYDVPMNHYALNSINKLVELGIISLDDEKKFRPDDVITLEEACKMLVSALGYDEMARVKGGYPTGYLLVSNMIGVTSNLNENELSTSTAISMLYNALKADVEDVISI
ncbi:MAG: S-layer homology domain-containing protein, partial [Eubacteriales bacterium]|nr:S-layer homology domain-containing protein [Eubacteriales bacterium]